MGYDQENVLTDNNAAFVAIAVLSGYWKQF
jgi:hypothetical protein